MFKVKINMLNRCVMINPLKLFKLGVLCTFVSPCFAHTTNVDECIALKAPVELCKEAYNDDENAQSNLAYIFEIGQGVEVNIPEAVYWYEKAAQKGDVVSQTNLGALYLSGHKDFEKDYSKAFQYLDLAAKKGNDIAQSNLAYMYETGRGVNRDYNKAIELYLESANQGNIGSQLNLAYLYEKGYTGKVELEKAANWYLKAAMQGSSSAQNNLGLMYVYGNGVKKDPVEAYAWFYVSSQCNTYSKRDMEAVYKRFKQPSDKVVAETLGKQYYKDYGCKF